MEAGETMEKGTWSHREDTPADWTEAEMESLDKPSILLVEDDRDIRDMLVTLLGLAGFHTEACDTAEKALEHVRESPYDLILTDYCLPHRTGGWLLKQATAEGLLDATPAMVVTAHPSPIDIDGFEVISKPFDLDELVERVRLRLTEDRLQPKPHGAGKSGGFGDHDGQGECPGPIELILYVSTPSGRSDTAIENIKNVLSRFHSSRVRLTICDLSKNPLPAPEDTAALTAVATRSTGPRTFILSHLENPELLLELLEGCDQT